MNKNCRWALRPFLPHPCRSRRDLGLASVILPLAPGLEPQRGGVDDDRARASPALGEGLGALAEAEVLGAAPRHQVHGPRGRSNGD
eukprot:4844820-Pyramimonas_sp.AAC.1